MYFDIVDACQKREGEVFYVENEHSINFYPNQGGGYNLVLAYLNIIFDTHTRCATQIWGLHPRRVWIPKLLSLPPIQSGSFTFIDPTIQDVDDVDRIEGSFEWPTFFDEQKKLICIGNPESEPDDRAVEFATHCVAVIHHKRLKALWLQLAFYKTYPERA